MQSSCARLLLRLVQAWRCWGGLETLVSGVSVWRTSICWSTLAASHHQLVSDRYNIQHCLTSLREKYAFYLFLSYYISVWSCFGSQLACICCILFLIRKIFEGDCPSTQLIVNIMYIREEDHSLLFTFWREQKQNFSFH